MENCSLDFLDCEFRKNGYCDVYSSNPDPKKLPCIYGLASSRIPQNELKLLGDDARDWGYVCWGIEHLLATINKGKNQREYGKDWVIELRDGKTISLAKFTQENQFRPFELDKVDDAAIGAIDLKRMIYSSVPKRSHVKQAIGYSLSLQQQYHLKSNGFYVLVVNRPFRKQYGAKRTPKFHILHVEKNNPIIGEILTEMSESYIYQREIFSDKDKLEKERQKRADNDYCNNCFEQEFCGKAFKKIDQNKCTLEELLVDDFKSMSNDFKLRWSEINSVCPIKRIYSKVNKLKLSKEFLVEEKDVTKVGTTMHTIFNRQHVDDFIHNQTLLDFGVEPVKRTDYCEKKVTYYSSKPEFKISGHSDAFIMVGNFKKN